MADGTITAPAYHDGLAKKTSLTGSERIIISDNASDKTTTTAVMRDFVANAVTDTFNQKIADEAAARSKEIADEAKYRLGQDQRIDARIDNCDNLILDIKKGFCDMGEFETEAKALSALGDLTYCSSNAYCVLHAHYSKEGKECNMVCIQSFNEDAENNKHLVRQFLFNRDKVWQRCIYFTDKTRTEIKSRDNWEATFCDRLHWDADTRKLVPSLFGHTFNKDYTDAIPLSNSTTDGLMSKTQAAMLDSASAEIGAYAYANAAMTAARTAQAGFNDFKVWRASAAADALTLKVSSSTTATKYEAKFPCATETTAGVMTAAQAKKLADLATEVAERKAADAALDARVTTAQETADGLTWLYAVASAECTITINATTYTVPARKPLRASLPKGTTAITSFSVSAEAKQCLHTLRLTGRKVTVPASHWGYQCTALTSLDLSALDMSAASQAYSIANGATSLRKFTGYEDWDTGKVTNFVTAFQKTALTSLDLSLWDTGACTNMGSLFCQSYSLADVGDISQWDTRKVTTIKQIFLGTALTSLDLSGWDLQSCTACELAFYGCTKLATLKLGAGWGKMPGTPTLDLSPLTAWTTGWDTLGLLYNRATAGLGTMTIKLPAAVYNGLNELGLIAYLKQAGYNIAKA